MVCCTLMKQEPPDDAGFSSSDQLLQAAFPLLLILLLQWDCLWLWPLKRPKVVDQTTSTKCLCSHGCLPAGTRRRWTTGSAVLSRLLVAQVCWSVGQGLSTATTALPSASAADGTIKPVKLTQHTLRETTKIIISIIS